MTKPGLCRRSVLRRSRELGAGLGLAAWLGCAGLARAEPVQIDIATEREREARARYDAGVSAYQEGRYQHAITSFLIADELAPRGALAFNIARAYERLEDHAQALRYYRDYLRREAAPVNREGVRARIAQLEAILAARGVQQLTVLTDPPGAFVSIDGQPRGPTPWTGELVPGRHQLSLLKEGYPVTKRELELDPAHAAEISVRLGEPSKPASVPASAPPSKAAPGAASAPAPERSSRGHASPSFGLWPWLTLGAGGALLVGAAGFELSRASAERDARAAKTQLDYIDRYETMESRQTAARILVGVGGALVVAGGVLLVFELTPKDRAPVKATADCSADGCTAALGGAF